MSALKYGLLATAAIAAVAFLSIYNFITPKQLVGTTRPAATAVPPDVVLMDLAPGECPQFAGDEFKEHREAYVRNLYVYQQMDMGPTSTDVAALSEDFYARIMGQLDSDPEMAVLADRLGEIRMHALADQVALVIARGSGMPTQDYLTRLTGGQFVTPANVPAGTLAENVYGREAFDQLSKRAESSSMITKLAATPQGVRVALAELPFDRMFGMLTDTLNEEDNELMYGLVHACALVCYQSPNLETLRMDNAKVVAFEMSLVVEDAAKDRYPFWITLYFDEKAGRWFTYYPCSMVSVRKASKPQQTY